MPFPRFSTARVCGFQFSVGCVGTWLRVSFFFRGFFLFLPMMIRKALSAQIAAVIADQMA